MAEKSDGRAEWGEIDQEERIRHEALFYNQGPIEGLLAGEQARELFLKSKLPLQVLSQIWNLVDHPHDNMLDVGEFLVAMHLIQGRMLGYKLPRTLPATLIPQPREEVRPEPMKEEEYLACRKLFEYLGGSTVRSVAASRVREILLSSGLSADQLALIWNLSDVDRDGRLSEEEFAVACHLTKFLQKEGTINGPLNVQLLFPNKIPKHDLPAKKRRLAELGSTKLKLMALRERRKAEAGRESRRVEVFKERLQVLALQHQFLCEDGLSSEADEAIQQELDDERERVARMEIVSQRLRKEHEKVRQETARVIVEEQKLSQEVKILEEKAAEIRKKRERNSLIKDLDPFHQLHEERKEEKRTGKQAPKPEFEIQIPQKNDPFDKEKLTEKPLSGQDIFVKNEELCSSPTSPNDGAWKTEADQSIMDLTCGFDDNFVELWTKVKDPSKVKDEWSMNSLESQDSFFQDEDPIFKTVPVTEEEDELWSTLPQSVLANQNEQIQILQAKLIKMKEKAANMEGNGGQLVFRHEQDYAQYERANSWWDRPVARRRASEGNLLRQLSEKSAPPPTWDASARRRSFGENSSKPLRSDAISRRKPLHANKPAATREESSNVDSYFDSLAKRNQSNEETVSVEKSASRSEWEELYVTAEIEVDDVFKDNNKPQEDIANNQVEDLKEESIEIHEPNSQLTVQKPPRVRIEKRRSLSREKAIVDDSEYVIAESLSSLIPKTDSVDYCGDKEEFLQLPENPLKSGRLETVREVSSSQELSSGKGSFESVGRTPDVSFDSQDASKNLSDNQINKAQNTSPQIEEKLSILSEKSSNYQRNPLEDTELTKKLEKEAAKNLTHSSYDIASHAYSPPVAPPRKNSPKKRNSRVDLHTSFDSFEDLSSECRPRLRSDLISRRRPLHSPPSTNREAESHSIPSSPSKRDILYKSPVKSVTQSPQLSDRSSRSNSDPNSIPGLVSSPSPPRSFSSPTSSSPSTSNRSTPAQSPSPRRPSSHRKAPKRPAPAPPPVCTTSDNRPRSISVVEHSSVPPPPPRRKTSSPEKGQVVRRQKSPEQKRPRPVSAFVYSESQASPVPPPRVKRKSKVKLGETRSKHKTVDESGHSGSPVKRHSLPSQFGPELSEDEERMLIELQRLQAQNIGGEVQDLENMDPETRRMQLESMRAQFFGRSNMDSGDIFSGSLNKREEEEEEEEEENKTSLYIAYDNDKKTSDYDTADSSDFIYENVEYRNKIDIRNDDLENDNVSYENSRTILNLTDDVDDAQRSSIDKGEHEKDMWGRGEIDTPRSKTVLNFNEDKDDTNTYENVTFLSSRPIGDHHHENASGIEPQKTVLNVSNDPDNDEVVYENVRLQNSKIVLDLDSHQYTSEVKAGRVQDDKSRVTSGQDYVMRDRQDMENVLSGNKVNVVFHSSDHDMSSHDGSISNYGESETSTQPESLGLPKSELEGHTDDSDLSDDEGTFQATFEPRMSEEVDEEDSGITLVSYHPNNSRSRSRTKSPSLRDVEAENASAGRASTEVNLTLTRSYSPEIKPIPKEGLITLTQVTALEAHNTVLQRPQSSQPPVLPSSGSAPSKPAFLPHREDRGAGQPSVVTLRLGERPGENAPPIKAQQLDLRASSNQSALSPSKQLETKSSSPPDVVSQATPPSHGPGMDPVTGLRKTGLITAVDKAVNFVQNTEPSFKVKRKEDKPSPPGSAPKNEQDVERKTLLDSMRVRRKKVELWMPEYEENEPPPINKTDSEKKYEERRRGEKKFSVPDVIPVGINTSLVASPNIKHPKKPGDVDSRSIADQDRMKKHWEDKIATGEVSLFPRQPEPGNKVSSSIDLSEFKSEVETQSIANLATTKEAWEKLSEEREKEKEREKVRLKEGSMRKQDETYLNNNIYAYDSHDEQNYENESAIDREIRLAQEREAELKREKENLEREKYSGSEVRSDVESYYSEEDMPIHKVPPPVRVVEVVPKKLPTSEQPPSPQTPVSPPPSNTILNLMPSAKVEFTRKESIIDREIREQQEREEEMKRQSEHKLQAYNKELEQSEYERREKEQERNAHESIVEREIRYQHEREKDFEVQRTYLSSGPTSPGLSYKPPLSPVSAPPTLGVRDHDATDSVSRSKASSLKPPSSPMTDYEPAIEEAMPYENSVPSSTPAPDGKHVSYEEAISTYAHRGESMIARELREQKEKEEELRARWQEMGLESPLEPSIPDTPYNRPDLPEPKMTLLPRPGTRDTLVYGDMIGTVPAPRRISAVSSKPSVPPETTNGGTNGVEVPKAKVTPWHAEDEDEEDGSRQNYVPQYETPIEREIRLAHEREEELRIQKKLPMPNPNKDSDIHLEVKGDMAPRRPHLLYRKGDEVQEAGTMKKLASSRLAQEIEKEKEREMELHRIGRIHTLSDQRMGDSNKKYVDIIPKDSPAPSPNPPRTPTTPKTPSYLRSPVSTMSSSSTPPVSRTVSVEPKPTQRPLHNGNVSNGAAPSHNKQDQRSSRFSGPNRQPNQAETLIEKELREMREREEELSPETSTSDLIQKWRQREGGPGKKRSQPADVQNNNATKTNGSANQNEVRLRTHANDTSSTKPRRKSALAAEWEKKFGNS